MYRVAEFERAGVKNQFTGFGKKGYFLESSGKLFAEGVEMNLTDRRKNLYREINFFTGKKDKYGKKVYDKDIIYLSQFKRCGVIEYQKFRGAFVWVVKNGKFKIPFSYLDILEQTIEKKGNVYENNFL